MASLPLSFRRGKVAAIPLAPASAFERLDLPRGYGLGAARPESSRRIRLLQLAKQPAKVYERHPGRLQTRVYLERELLKQAVRLDHQVGQFNGLNQRRHMPPLSSIRAAI
jgi:hypothetical protein